MTILRFIRQAFSTLHAAVEAAAAVDAHRVPTAATLDKLGISRKAFASIHI